MLRALSRVMGGRVLARGRDRRQAGSASDRGSPSGSFNSAAATDRASPSRSATNSWPCSAMRSRLSPSPTWSRSFDLSSGLPLASSETEVNRPVAVFVVPRDKLILGRAMRDRSLLDASRTPGRDSFCR